MSGKKVVEKVKIIVPCCGILFGLPLAAVPPLVSGCVAPEPGLPMETGQEQDDVPVPQHFELKFSESPRLAVLEPFRSYTAVYEGSGRHKELTPWYIRSMQKHGWEFQRLERLANETKLHFRKNGESSLIQLYRELDPRIGAYKNVVRVEIHPLGNEDRTVEENLRLSGQQPVRPASFAKQDAPEEEKRKAGETAPKATETQRIEKEPAKESISEEIERYENP